MYKFKIGNHVTDLIEASSEAIARMKLAKLWQCDLKDLPKNMEVFPLTEEKK